MLKGIQIVKSVLKVPRSRGFKIGLKYESKWKDKMKVKLPNYFKIFLTCYLAL